MKCSYCNNKAIIRIYHKGLLLCKECFIKYFEAKFLRAIEVIRRTYKLSNKHIIVSASGGKDSLNVLYLLKKYSSQYGYTLEAVFVDEGIGDYRKRTLNSLVNFCLKYKINYTLLDMKKEMGYYISEVADLYLKGKIKYKPCSICGVFRRYMVNKYALEIGADFVATGHNLDDEVQTFIMSLLRNDLGSIVREGIITEKSSENFVPRIKPLYYIYEKESLAYALLKKFNIFPKKCPYSIYSMRYDIRKFLNKVETLRPGAKENILKEKEYLRNILKKNFYKTERLKKCEVCGMPTTHNICRACYFKQIIEKALIS